MDRYSFAYDAILCNYDMHDRHVIANPTVKMIVKATGETPHAMWYSVIDSNGARVAEISLCSVCGQIESMYTISNDHIWVAIDQVNRFTMLPLSIIRIPKSLYTDALVHGYTPLPTIDDSDSTTMIKGTKSRYEAQNRFKLVAWD